MAELPIVIPTSTPGTEQAITEVDQLIDTLEKLNEVIEEKTEATEQNTEATEENTEAQESGGIAINAYLEIGKKGIDIAIQTAQQLKALYDEYQKQSNIIKGLSGSINEASNRLNGFISRLDLMTARNRLASSGLELTEHQFANLGVAAQNFAQRTGRDTLEVFNEMSDALRDGTGKLEEFGIATNGATGKVNVQREALASLEEQFGETEAAGFSMAHVMDDLKTEFVEALEASGSLDQSLSEMEQTVKDLGVQLGFVSSNDEGGIGFLESQAMLLEIAVESLNIQLKRASDILQGIATANYGQVFSTIVEALPDPTGGMQAGLNVRGRRTGISQGLRGAQAGLNAPVTPSRTSGGGGGSPRESLDDIAQRASDEAEINTQIEERNELLAIEADRLQRIADEAAFQAQLEADEEAQAELRFERQLERDRLEFEQRQQLLEKETQEKVAAQERNSRIQKDAFNQIAMFTIKGTKAVVDAEGSKKKALALYTKQWLHDFGKQMGFKALEMTAEGIGLLPSPAAGPKFASAAAFGALAGATMGGSAAIKGGGSSGVGGSNEKQGPVSTATNNSSTSNTVATTIIINVPNQNLLDKAQMGLVVKEGLDAANQKYR